jgi:hypothetical protein
MFVFFAPTLLLSSFSINKKPLVLNSPTVEEPDPHPSAQYFLRLLIRRRATTHKSIMFFDKVFSDRITL